MEWSTTVLGSIKKVDQERGFGFCAVQGRPNDFYFKLDQVRHTGGIELRREDSVKCTLRTNRRREEYIHQIELTHLASKTSRQLDAVQRMALWCQKLRAQDAGGENGPGLGEKAMTLAQAGNSLPVWRAVTELLNKAMHPQWDALAPDPSDTGAGTASVEDQPISPGGPKRLPRRDFVYGCLAEEIMHEQGHLRGDLPTEQCTMPVKDVFFTHGEVSAQFRNGATLTQLVSDLRRGHVLPAQDSRMFLDVFKLKQRTRSVNNRRLWVLKEFQRERQEQIQVGVKLHAVCRGTANFLLDLAESACAKVTPDVAGHPVMVAAKQTLQDVMEEESSRPWVFEDRAEIRSRVSLDDLRFVGQTVQPPRKRRRDLRDEADDELVEAESSVPSASERNMTERICGGICRGKESLDVVEFRGYLYIADKKLGQLLHQNQQEKQERFCVNVRVIPLCPMTAKVVLANSTQNDGESVHIRGSLRDEDGWPMERIVSLLLELTRYIKDHPRAKQVVEVLGTSRLVGERNALIKACRSNGRWSADVVRGAWNFLQDLMQLAPSKFQAALPICSYLCHAEGNRNAVDAPASQLLFLVSAAAQQLSGTSGGAQDVPWNCMAMVPSDVELKSLEIMPNTRKRSALQRLPVVRQCGSYRSAGEYFDTYFRLLREDCLSAICQSFTYVRSMGSAARPDEAREADGNVFRAKLQGFTVGKGDCDSRIKAVFRVEPMFSRKRWEFRAMRFFMNGNLLACVCDDDFSEPIWLLAARRDLNRKEAEVALEFYLSDGSDEAMLLSRLCNSRRLTLIASPTYFRSFEPVLQSLKTWEAVGLPFHKELVECEPVGVCGMLADRRVQRSLIFSPQDTETAPAPEDVVKTARAKIEALGESMEEKDDDNIMLSNLPEHVAASSSAASHAASPLQYQVLGVSTDVIGLSMNLPAKGKIDVKVNGEVLFEIHRPNPLARFSCCNRCKHQIQLQLPQLEGQNRLRILQPGASAELQISEEIVTSTGAKEYRFRLAALAGTVTQLREEIATAIAGSPTGVLARQTTWDTSQLQAAEHALQCRVALIQGPPGTGKTFIGCKLLQMFLPQSRVLVLTYKNHALDDFLEHCIDAGHTEQVARIGGRSTTERQELQGCNLRSLRKKLEALSGSMRKKRKADVEVESPVLRQLLQEASHAKFTVADAQHDVLTALDRFRDRGVHRVETFLHGISGKQIVGFLERSLQSWHRQHQVKLDECMQKITAKLQGNWDQLPALLHSIDSQDPDGWMFRELKDNLDWALSDWYPKKQLLDEAAREYFAEIKDQEVEENDVERVVTSDEVVVQVQNNQELRKVQMNLGPNQQVFRSFQLGGQHVEQGWRLSKCTNPHGKPATDLAAAAAPLPLLLSFEPDDEAEKELQAEIEAERLQGAGLDTRESLSEAERKAMIATRPEDVEKRPYLARLPCNLSGDHALDLRNPDLFRLSQKERAQVVVRQIAWQAQQSFQQLQEAVNALATACEEERVNDVNFNAQVLESRKIIGMTITGASIHLGLLKQIKPDVVIVEEAAEVLEPQILAVLGPWVKHLILIGDHRQLPPPVETYTLKLNHLFDTSMLERLIHNRLPNVELCRQGRMLPSLSRLLRPIYAFLRDNEKVVQRLKAPDCVKSEVFFWNCPHQEEKTDRSHINKYECERAVQLACYFISQGVQPSCITLLAAYQAQMSLISREIKQHLPEFLKQNGFKRELLPCKVEIDPSLIRRNNEVEITEAVIQQGRVVGEDVKVGGYFAKEHRSADAPRSWSAATAAQPVLATLEPSKLQAEEMPQCSTIDRYQGAENEIVIISLVRSNHEKKIGFLGTEDGKNRMCVAQSRAKRGLYFIGNVECMRSAVHWKQLLNMLDERGAVGDLFPQICPRHPDIQNFAKEAENVGIVCKHICGKAFGCGIAGHVCKRQCHADDRGDSHQAGKCPILVEKTYNCQEDPPHVFPNIPCMRRTENQPCPFFELLRCKRDLHDLRRTCGETVEHAVFVCPNPCTTRLACGHLCPKKCSETCIVEGGCPALVEFDCPNFAKHSKIQSACNSTPAQIAAKCKSKCSRVLTCGHHCDELCCDPCTTRCTKDCKKMLSCGHRCPKKCSEQCAEVSECKAPKFFDCPLSKEHGQIRSRCNSSIEDLKALCQSPCNRALPCGHDCQERCCDPCTNHCKQPCTKRLECGHTCPLECWETCIEPAACEELCGRKMSCGHECQERCCDLCVCNQPCGKRLVCGHVCLMKCPEECKCIMPKVVPCKKTLGQDKEHKVQGMCCEKDEDISMRCQETCGEILPCGHSCQKLCSQCPVPHEPTECRSLCGRELPCGHPCSRPCGACGGSCPVAPCALCLQPPLPKAMPRPPAAPATKAMPAMPAMPRLEERPPQPPQPEREPRRVVLDAFRSGRRDYRSDRPRGDSPRRNTRDRRHSESRGRRSGRTGARRYGRR